MFDDTKIQALADSLRTTARRHVYQITGDHVDADAADRMLVDIIQQLLVGMSEDRNRCLAMLETLKQQFSSE